jgi:DNA adenine methylase
MWNAMIYLGGKHYAGKAIAAELRKAYTPGAPYYEPFVGGGHVLYRVAEFIDGPMYVSDLSSDLMILWRAVAAGYEPPTELSREEWAALKIAEPSPLRSAAGFGLSFSGKWFGGYGAANRPSNAQFPCRALARSFDQRRAAFARAVLACCSYSAYSPEPGALVYCDPPYKDTTTFVNVEPFDHAAFWRWAEASSLAGARVFVSEYQAPDGWNPVLEKQIDSKIKAMANKATAKGTEKLFTYAGTAN